MTIEKAAKWLISQGLCMYRVMQGREKVLSSSEESTTPEKAANELLASEEFLQKGKLYKLAAKNSKTTNSKGEQYYTFTLGNEVNEVSETNAPNFGIGEILGVMNSNTTTQVQLMQAQMQLEIERIKHQNELELERIKHKRKIDELNSKDDSWAKIGEIIKLVGLSMEQDKAAIGQTNTPNQTDSDQAAKNLNILASKLGEKGLYKGLAKLASMETSLLNSLLNS